MKKKAEKKKEVQKEGDKNRDRERARGALAFARSVITKIPTESYSSPVIALTTA